MSRPHASVDQEPGLSRTELRSNRRALLALLAITLLAAIVAGIGVVARVVDDDAGRPNRSGARTLDGDRVIQTEDTGDGIGVLPIAGVALAAGACVATPLVLARRRRQRAGDRASQ